MTDSTEIRFPDVVAELTETDGNVFALMGQVTKALKRAGYREHVDEFIAEVTSSRSYDEALDVMCRWVDVR